MPRRVGYTSAFIERNLYWCRATRTEPTRHVSRGSVVGCRCPVCLPNGQVAAISGVFRRQVADSVGSGAVSDRVRQRAVIRV